MRDREKAFVSAEFKDYNPRVEYHVSKFIEVLRKTEGKVSTASSFMVSLVVVPRSRRYFSSAWKSVPEYLPVGTLT